MGGPKLHLAFYISSQEERRVFPHTSHMHFELLFRVDDFVRVSSWRVCDFALCLSQPKWVEPQRTRFSAQEIVTHFPELPIHFVKQHTIIATVLTLFAYYIHTSRSCANREPSFT